MCLENHSERSAESCKAADAFVVALFNLFSRMTSVPQALTLVLEPYLERAQLWEQLHTLAGKGANVNDFPTLCLVFSLGLTFPDGIDSLFLHLR